MIAPGPVHRKSFVWAGYGLETGESDAGLITKTLKPPTITPYFGQLPVTLD